MFEKLIVRRRGLGYDSTLSLASELDTDIQTLEAGQVAAPAELYIRWGATQSVANEDAKVLNSSKAIHRGSDKAGFRQLLGALAPKTWYSVEDVPEAILHSRGVVIRPARHAGGKSLFHCKTVEACIMSAMSCGVGFYITEYIPKTHEFRVHCVQGRVVGVSEKNPVNRDAVAWNFHGEDGNGEFDNLKWSEWPMDVVNFALAAFAKSRLHFGAVDVMHDGTRPYVLEVNSAPSLSPYRASCYGRALRYSLARGALKVGEYEYARPLEIYDWKAAIHPGLQE